MTAALFVHGPNIPYWVRLFPIVLFGAAFAVYIGAFLYLLFRDKDALRSETYSLKKLAIEQGLVGDNETGFFAKSDVLELHALLNQPKKSRDKS